MVVRLMFLEPSHKVIKFLDSKLQKNIDIVQDIDKNIVTSCAKLLSYSIISNNICELNIKVEYPCDEVTAMLIITNSGYKLMLLTSNKEIKNEIK